MTVIYFVHFCDFGQMAKWSLVCTEFVGFKPVLGSNGFVVCLNDVTYSMVPSDICLKIIAATSDKNTKIHKKSYPRQVKK